MALLVILVSIQARNSVPTGNGHQKTPNPMLQNMLFREIPK